MSNLMNTTAALFVVFQHCNCNLSFLVISDFLSLMIYIKGKTTDWLTYHEFLGTTERIAMKIGTQFPLRS